MSMKDEIAAAIAAHGQWKVRLKDAISTGSIGVSIDTIRVDNQCAFGKWFYGPTISAEIKSSSHYKNIKELHAQFHKVAASVAELAIAGKKDEAEKALSVTSEFAGISSTLTKAMMDWKNAVNE